MCAGDMMSRLEAMQAALAGKPHLKRLGALFSDTVLFEVDGRDYYLHFHRGALERIEQGPSRKIPWQFALRTDAQALEEFWKPLPAPGFHDIFGLVKIGRARIEGDILRLVRNLRFFKEFMALARGDAA
ncbi:hypothetical protein [Oricola nitratireducens]|uniref:hypothetical protein n=1 Tax=Oricola nitratireducens TaxID=2775868 RepID=UPI001FEDE547|nr:hypothetical protein [Oricola nitratireducens]